MTLAVQGTVSRAGIQPLSFDEIESVSGGAPINGVGAATGVGAASGAVLGLTRGAQIGASLGFAVSGPAGFAIGLAVGAAAGYSFYVIGRAYMANQQVANQ